jgi:hypothetical protein
MHNEFDNIEKKIATAVKHFWNTRKLQQDKQGKSIRSGTGARAAVTGGAQMDGFNQLITDLIIEAGIDISSVFYKKNLELPGYFRPEKKWDIVVVKEQQLIAAIEAKSQVGPSFGNNFNNRTEEAVGSAVDIWTAYREGKFNKTLKPWIGYVFMLEYCQKSNSPVNVKETHFTVFDEFKKASYCKRYALLCRKLLRERHYSATCFITSEKESGLKGSYKEPSEELSFVTFAKSLTAHIKTYI